MTTELKVLDAEVVAIDGVPIEQLMPQPLQHPPAVRATCTCGKRDEYAHGGYSCETVLQIAARVAYGQLPRSVRRRTAAPIGWPR